MSAADTTGVDTGRLGTALSETARRILFGDGTAEHEDELSAELRDITEVDRAHLVMLTEQGIVASGKAQLLLHEIQVLRATDFAELRGRPAPRGRYLSYESYLIEKLGVEVGGVLHTGRSRNDLNATTIRLRVRKPYAELLTEALRLGAVLHARATEHQRVVMPAYTHRQPAVPITYGHYLAGLGNAVLRGVDGLLHAGKEIDVNPLGAGAVGGTSVGVDRRHTARLLGFEAVAASSLDAVASRDFVLRLLAASAVLGVAIARSAQDFSLWSTEEFGLLHVPDDLVGSSSMMPQKRNPFVLEHIQGKAAAPVGAFVSSASSMLTAGYTNAIAVGTEAATHLWPALRNSTEAVVLMRLFADGARPVAERMMERASNGFTTATYLAERLVADGMPFRAAHHEVGRLVLRGLEHGQTLDVVARDHFAENGGNPVGALDPETVAAAGEFGGGPGPRSLGDSLSALDAELTRLNEIATARGRRWETAAQDLEQTVQRLLRQS
ncbi:argininosuccinate lyase [Streptosporangium sp. NPDC000396]|uniref:argininosuccinate lyase n=1 Tax=Streptosporangium sp. NPDC000396 TaxID=3366185 RepID=UPI003673AB92